MGQEHGRHERKVGCVRKQQLVKRRIFRKRTGRANPEHPSCRALLGLKQALVRIDHAKFNGAFGVCPIDRELRKRILRSENAGSLVDECFGRRSVGHRIFMLDACLFALKRCRHVNDRLSALDADHASRRKGSAVAYIFNLVIDRQARIARTQKIRLKRVGAPIRRNGL